jgi:autotransporter-associated beta strand protein
MNFSNTSVISGAAGGITVYGGGSVTLSGNNTYGTATDLSSNAAVDGGTVIRSGTIHLANNNGLGATVVELGDSMKVLTAVDRATNSTSLLMLGGGNTLGTGANGQASQGATFDATNNGLATGQGGPGAFVNVSTTIDGHVYTSADADTVVGNGTGKRILVMAEDGNPERNGIYEIASVSSDGLTMTLVRTSDFSTALNMNYGVQVTVTNGTFASQTYFMAAPSVTVPNQPDSDPTAWLLDAGTSATGAANVALLADINGLSIGNKVDVNNTNGTGTSTIGGSSLLTSGNASFTGAITLQDVTGTVIAAPKTLLLSSFTSTGDGVTFSGIISEANSADDTLALQTAPTNTGIVTLNAVNTYHGQTLVTNGVLRVENNSALGAADGTAATGTVVSSGAELQLSGSSLSIGNEALFLNGAGLGGTGGALHNFGASGNNTYGGPITLQSASTILADSGTTLNLNSASAIATAGFTLTFNTAGTTNVSSGINGSGAITATGAGTTNLNGIVAVTNATSVTKNGAGSLVFGSSAVNTYTGTTTINQGIVQIQNNSSLGSGDGTAATGTTVNAGGELQVNTGSTLTVSNEALFLNGTGVGGAGALNVFSGTATFNAGPITLATSATVSANSGASLVLGTNTTGNHPNIVATGPGPNTLTTVGPGTTTIVDAVNTGTGGLTVSSGTTILNNPTLNPSTYSGATTVNGGTLQVGIAGIGSTGTGGGTPGAVTVNSGGTIAGTGTVNGASTIAAGGIISPGDSAGTGIGTIHLASSLTMNSTGAASSIANLQINSATSTDADKIAVTGTLTLSPTTAGVTMINVTFANTFAEAPGQFWDLLDWGTLASGTFSAGTNLRNGGNGGGNLALPTLTSGLGWDISNFLVNGQVAIVSTVPEPSRVLLLLSGLAALTMRRRRQTA